MSVEMATNYKQRHSLKAVVTYEVELTQLKSIERAASGIGVPLAAAFALIPTSIALTHLWNTRQHCPLEGFRRSFSLMWVCYILGGICAILAYINRGNLKQCIQDIRVNQVPPVAAKTAQGQPDLTPISDPEAQPTVRAHDAEDN